MQRKEAVTEALDSIVDHYKGITFQMEWIISQLEMLRPKIGQPGINAADKVMDAKRQLMTIQAMLPLYMETCLFCLYHRTNRTTEDCNDCQYGKQYGICMNDNSTFRQLLNKRDELREAIFHYHSPYSFTKWEERT